MLNVNSTSKGFLRKVEKSIGFNALRNSLEDFDYQESNVPYQWNKFSAEETDKRDDANAKDRLPKQTHAFDIIPRDFVEVCIDIKQQGAGDYDCCGSKPIKAATIYSDKDYKRSFTFVSLSKAKDVAKS